MSDPIPLFRLANISAPCESGQFIMGLHVVEVLPGDPRFRIAERGVGPVEAMERLVDQLDRAIADLGAVRTDAERMIRQLAEG